MFGRAKKEKKPRKRRDRKKVEIAREPMHPDLEKAKSILDTKKATCVLVRDSVLFISAEKGLTPLLDWANSGNNYVGFMIADKIVGRAAALIDISLGVRGVYAEIISEPAQKLLKDNNILVFGENVVPEILNADMSDVYPVDKAVKNIENAAYAFEPIERAVAEMQS